MKRRLREMGGETVADRAARLAVAALESWRARTTLPPTDDDLLAFWRHGFESCAQDEVAS